MNKIHIENVIDFIDKDLLRMRNFINGVHFTGRNVRIETIFYAEFPITLEKLKTLYGRAECELVDQKKEIELKSSRKYHSDVVYMEHHQPDAPGTFSIKLYTILREMAQ